MSVLNSERPDRGPDDDGVALIDGTPAHYLGSVKFGRLFIEEVEEGKCLVWVSPPGRGTDANDIHQALSPTLWVTMQSSCVMESVKLEEEQYEFYPPKKVELNWKMEVLWELCLLADGEYVLRNRGRELFSIIERVPPLTEHQLRKIKIKALVQRERKRETAEIIRQIKDGRKGNQ